MTLMMKTNLRHPFSRAIDYGHRGAGSGSRGDLSSTGGDAGYLPGIEGFLLKRLASLASKFMTLGSWRFAAPTGGVARVDVQRGAVRPARGVRPRRRGR
jgi:hypothetical protein